MILKYKKKQKEKSGFPRPILWLEFVRPIYIKPIPPCLSAKVNAAIAHEGVNVAHGGSTVAAPHSCERAVRISFHNGRGVAGQDHGSVIFTGHNSFPVEGLPVVVGHQIGLRSHFSGLL